jgi:hypothetical protein
LEVDWWLLEFVACRLLVDFGVLKVTITVMTLTVLLLRGLVDCAFASDEAVLDDLRDVLSLRPADDGGVDLCHFELLLILSLPQGLQAWRGADEHFTLVRSDGAFLKLRALQD